MREKNLHMEKKTIVPLWWAQMKAKHSEIRRIRRKCAFWLYGTQTHACTFKAYACSWIWNLIRMVMLWCCQYHSHAYTKWNETIILIHSITYFIWLYVCNTSSYIRHNCAPRNGFIAKKKKETEIICLIDIFFKINKSFFMNFLW